LTYTIFLVSLSPPLLSLPGLNSVDEKAEAMKRREEEEVRISMKNKDA
jgi:hypothetical protein